MEINWITIEEVTFFSTIWTIGFLVSLFRTLSDDTDQSVRVSIFSSGLVGFYSLACVAIRIGEHTDGISGIGSHIFIAILIGAAGPYHEKIIYLTLKKVGFLPNEKDKNIDTVDPPDSSNNPN